MSDVFIGSSPHSPILSHLYCDFNRFISISYSYQIHIDILHADDNLFSLSIKSHAKIGQMWAYLIGRVRLSGIHYFFQNNLTFNSFPELVISRGCHSYKYKIAAAKAGSASSMEVLTQLLQSFLCHILDCHPHGYEVPVMG